MSAAADRLTGPLGIASGVLLAVGLLAVGFLPPGVVVLSIPFLVVAARKPVLRRLALRNASRRPRETALILLGALLGTAIITGSAAVGDTLGGSIRQGAFASLGPIDELVRTSGLENQEKLLAAVQSAPKDDIDGILPLVAVGASVARPGTDPRAEPQATFIEVDFAAARAFGDDPKSTGIEGATPGVGEAVLSKDLARTLDAEVGSSVDAFLYGAQRSYKVVRILDRKGIAGFHLGFGSAAPNIFVAPGTIAELVAANPTTGSPPSASVAVSNIGGVVDGADRSAAAIKALEPAIAAAGLQAQTVPVKKDLLDGAEEQGKSFTQLFTSLGTFSALAGILLLISIFIMLAEERKTELGMLRAVGLKRAGLVGTFSLEGWMYSLGAAALGTIAGIGVGRAIVAVTAGIFGGDGDFALELNYTVTRESIQRGFLVGFIFSLLTVLATSIWVSRLNVIRAIRDLPEPTVKTSRFVVRVIRRSLQVLVLLVGVAFTLSGLSQKSPAPLLLGPPLALLGVAMLVRRRLNTRAVDSVAAVLSLVWATMCFDLVPEVFTNPDISLFVLDGVVLTVAGVLLVSRHQRSIGGVVRTVGGGSKSMSLRLGLAYPLAKGFRTSLILSTFTLVMYTLISITLFSAVFAGQIDDFTADVSGGFDGQVFSNASNPVPVDAVTSEPGVASVAALATVGAQFNIPSRPKPEGANEFEFWPLAGYDAAFVDGGPPSLQEFLPEFGDETGAWRALLTDPTLIIVDEFFLQQGGGPPEASIEPGEEVIVQDPVSGVTKSLRVAALADSGFGQSTSYMGLEAVRQLVGTRAVTNSLRYKVAPGADPQEVAERLKGKYVANGVNATSFRKAVGDGLAQQQQFFRLMQGYLSLGLIVSVAGIGVVMVRAVRERRREVGILRALGFETRQVRRAFVAESSFVGLEGILLGTSLAIVSSWRLLTSGSFGDGLEFSVPYGQVLLIVGLAFLATLAATASPAQQASKIRPAVALRITD